MVTNNETFSEARDASDSSEALSGLIAEVIQRRHRGEHLTDEDIIAAHPDLMPALASELGALREIHRAFLAAQKAGPVADIGEGEALADCVAEEDLEQQDSADPGQDARSILIRGYGIVRQISEGGQGIVYEAVQESTGRRVAIKVIPGGPFISSRHRGRFEREVEILARLEHPNIVCIIDSGRTGDGSLFMAMNFVDGLALDEYIERGRAEGRLDARTILELFVRIAEAVEEAHRHGVVHRDLKPSNVRIDRQGRPHILDFGLARLLPHGGEAARARSLTQAGQVVGSLPWVSPEQITDPDCTDARSDVYAMGMMLYQALSGTLPFSPSSPINDLLAAIVKEPPRPPSAAARSRDAVAIAPDLDAIILKALAKAPSRRYGSSAEFAAALKDHLAGKAAALPRGWRVDRRRILAAAGVICIAALCGGLYCWTMRVPSVKVIALPALTNSVGMTLVRIPQGQFRMGALSDAERRFRNETERQVTLTRPFYIGVTEVTQKQYRDLIGSLPDVQSQSGDDLPVEKVRWPEAVEYCRKLSEKEGRNYRLPTEAEWEFACRAGTTGAFGGTGTLEDMGWFRENSGGRLHPVARKLPNHWGLYDMHGGVRELCADGYGAYWIGSEVDPVGPPTPTGEVVVRGGNINDVAGECRSASRLAAGLQDRRTQIGFRVVLEAGDLPE